MDKIIVTVQYGSKKQMDLALPAEVPHQFLAEAVARALALPVTPKKQYLLTAVTLDGRKKFSPAATLLSAGIFAGTLLELSQMDAEGQGVGYLLTESGLRFSLRSTNTIGRTDKNDSQAVDIDLGPLGGKVISHWHARIDHIAGQYQLIDTNSTNGTWVNGIRLSANIPQTLQDDDVIEFGPSGKGGVKVIFQKISAA